MTPTKENAPGQEGRGMGTFAAPKGGEAKDTGFCLSVLNAWRYFNTLPGDLPAIVAALLVAAWALLRGQP